MKRKSALAGRLLQHFRADDVGGHEVRRELDALGIEPQYLTKGIDEQRLGEAGDADQQRVSARQDRHQRALDHDVLAEDHRGGGLVCTANPLGCGLQPGDDVLVGGRHAAHVGHPAVLFRANVAANVDRVVAERIGAEGVTLHGRGDHPGVNRWRQINVT